MTGLAAGGAQARVYVPDTPPGSSSIFRYKPKRLRVHLAPPNWDSVQSLSLSRLHWRRWNRERTIARRARMQLCTVGGLDEGCETYRVRVRLSRRELNACRDEKPRTLYSRLEIRGAPILGMVPAVFEPLLSC